MIQPLSHMNYHIDYRLLVSGYLPNYLYDLGALDKKWDMKQWYQHAYLNLRTQEFSHFKYPSSQNFSKVIRLGLPVNQLPLISLEH